MPTLLPSLSHALSGLASLAPPLPLAGLADVARRWIEESIRAATSTFTMGTATPRSSRLVRP